MNALKNILITLMMGSAILAQLLNPIHVSADGEITPPPVETIEATEPPVATDAPTEAIPTVTPSASDAPTVEPVITDIPTSTAEATEPPTEIATLESPTPVPSEAIVEQDPATTEEPTLLEAVQEISNETDVVVLDEVDQPLPLATQETADVVATGDPLWCPDGVAPIASTGGCTASYQTMSDLITNSGVYINGTNVNGTIWIESGDIGDVNPITINGSTYTNWANYSLTLQGGWGGGSNSVFTVPISISNWKNTVAIYNIDAPSINISNTNISGGGNILVTNSRANVTIDRANIQGANGFGLFVGTNGGEVTVKNSTIRDTVPDYSGSSYYPYGDGADIFSNGGNVTISNSQFINNNKNAGGYGAWVSAGSTGDLRVENSEFTDNSVGLSAFSSKDIYILKDNQFQNNFTGLAFYACSGNLLLELGVTFAGNYADVENWGGCSDPIPYVPPAGLGLGLSTHSSGKFALDCKIQGGFSVPLPNGDLVQIFCPVSGEAEIARLDNTVLPKTLPEGYTYASAFELNIIQSDEPIIVINDAGYIKASFIASNLNSTGNTYSILYWDPTEKDWIVLKDYMHNGNGSRSFYLDPEDPTRIDVRRKIISGVQLVSTYKDERVEVSTNFPGIFVLAQH